VRFLTKKLDIHRILVDFKPILKCLFSTIIDGFSMAGKNAGRKVAAMQIPDRFKADD
jgi:hypothetical protein